MESTASTYLLCIAWKLVEISYFIFTRYLAVLAIYTFIQYFTQKCIWSRKTLTRNRDATREIGYTSLLHWNDVIFSAELRYMWYNRWNNKEQKSFFNIFSFSFEYYNTVWLKFFSAPRSFIRKLHLITNR